MKILWIVLSAVLVVLFAGSVYTVGENEVALQFQFGRIVGSDIAPGLHFKIPVVQNVLLFDRRILTLDATPERYLTQEKKDVSVDYFATWRIADARRYYSATLGSDVVAEQRLTPIVVEALRNTINQRALQDIVSLDRNNLGGEMLRQVNAITRTSLGIEVVDIRIKRIDLPEESNVLSSVYERMRAERSRVALQLRAEGQEEAAKIQAEADREKLVMMTDAERDAEILKGEGDAQAAAISAQAYGQDPEFYAFYRSLQAYKTMFGGKDVIVLDPDSELLRYFANPGRAAAPAK
ncbi:MAG TPA: protease modulator HflC [Xanthomonadaceae bacterium]|jgi:membrane protease subunit HflC|nr:protease modulator HflC [Xanthomonadaceae bacterium]